MRFSISIFTLILTCSTAIAQPPRHAWTVKLDAVPAHAPLVGDFNSSAGLETVLGLPGDKAKAQCLNAKGETLWETELEGNTKHSAMPAATLYLLGRDALIAVAGENDLLVLQADTGRLVWRENTGALSLGGLMWLDLDGDQREELVAATADKRILAFNAEGERLWQYAELDHGSSFNVVGALSGADINNDKLAEIVVPLEEAVLALDGEGVMLWESLEGRKTLADPIIATPKGEFIPVVYALCQDPSGIFALDADLGTERWHLAEEDLKLQDQAPMSLEAEKSELLLADLNQDGAFEIIISDANGQIFRLDQEGALLGVTQLPDKSHAHLAAADADGDLQVEVLAATENGTVYQVDPWGNIVWSIDHKVPIHFAPLLGDFAHDVYVDLLFVDEEGTCTSRRSNSNYIPALMTWPQARQSASRTGALLDLAPWRTNETETLLTNGNFEFSEVGAETPLAWHMPEATAEWGLGEEKVRSGKRALWIKSGGAPTLLRSRQSLLPVGVQTISGSVLGFGVENPKITLQWLSHEEQVVREDEFTASTPQDGWVRFVLNTVQAPSGAYAVALQLSASSAGDSPVWWDDAKLDCTVVQAPVVEILRNQLGYESFAPKKFVVRSNFKAKSARFAILNDVGETKQEGDLTWGTRFKGGGEMDWPGYFWRGNFTEMYEKGRFRIAVDLDGVKVFSPFFNVDLHTLWDSVAPLTISALGAARCGDDNSAVWRTEANGDTTLTPEIFWEVAQLRRACAWRIERIDADADGKEDLAAVLSSIAPAIAAVVGEDGALKNQPVATLCGADEVTPASPEQLFLGVMGLARWLEQAEEKDDAQIEAVKHALDWGIAQGLPKDMIFNVAVDLAITTLDDKYTALAHELYFCCDFTGMAEAIINDTPEAARAGDTIESLIKYESQLLGDTLEAPSFFAAMELAKQADLLITEAKNPFGVFMYNRDGNLHCFPEASATPGKIGHSGHILQAALFVAQAYRFQPKQEYYDFVMDQINWILGCNPYGVSFLSGAGRSRAPQPKLPQGVDEKLNAGFLPYGPVASEPGMDKPLDKLTTACARVPYTCEADLLSTVHLLGTLAHIKRMPVGPEDR